MILLKKKPSSYWGGVVEMDKVISLILRKLYFLFAWWWRFDVSNSVACLLFTSFSYDNLFQEYKLNSIQIDDFIKINPCPNNYTCVYTIINIYWIK